MSLSQFISGRFNSSASMPPSVRVMKKVAAAGIAIAVAALVVALSIGRGFEKKYRKALLDFNAHVVIMGSGEIVDEKDVRGALADVKYIGKTRFIYREALILGGGTIKGVVVKGVDPETVRGVNSMVIKLFDSAPLLGPALSGKKGKFPVIMGGALVKSLGIGEKNGHAKLMIPREDKSKKEDNEFVNVDVVGSFESGMYEYDAQFLLMSLAGARKLFGIEKDAITGIELKLSDPENADGVAGVLKQKLGPRYSVVTWGELNHDLLAAVKLEEFVSAIIMGLMVLVAALNIVAVLVLIAINRFREISVLEALGTPEKVIRKVLVRGGLKISLVGLVGGVCLGIAVATAIGRFNLIPLEEEIYLVDSLPIDISPSLCGIITLLCLGVGFLASKLAARRLGSVSVTEGLKLAR